MFFSFFLFVLCFFFIILFSVHYMVVLLLLEALLLSIFLFYGWNFVGPFGLSGLFVFLLVMVCMGGFSISLLVSLSRGFGRDFWNFHFIF